MADDDDKIPQVVIPPDMQAEIDANPELAKAMQGMTEALKNAMQGVKDGRYASFEDAMEALTGQRPEKYFAQPRYPLKHGYCLSGGPDPRGDGMMAIISDGHPQMDADVTILDVKRVKSREEAEIWFKRQTILEPWADSKEPPVLVWEEKGEEAGPATQDDGDDDDKTVTH